MPEFVVVDRLVKRYGARLAVRGVSFAFEDGEVIGLLGPNGSGKSTILRVLAGYLPPSAGTARIAGIDVATDSLAARRQVGYVPEDAPLYDGMRVGEFLHFMAAIKGVASGTQHSAVGTVAERLQLAARLRIGGPGPAILAAWRQLQGVVDATPERVDTAPERVASAPAEIAETYLVETEPGRLAAADLARAIVGQGFDLAELVEVKPDLE